MTGVYVLSAIVGLPLVAYAVIAGDGDADGGDFAEGGVFAYLSLGTLAFFAGFFGATGLLLTWAGTGTVTGALLAGAVGLVAAGVHRGILLYAKRSSASSHVEDADFSGKVATVVVPFEFGSRGRVVIEIGSQRHYLTAELATREAGSLDQGSPVVIVQIERGVALVTRAGPELA